MTTIDQSRAEIIGKQQNTGINVLQNVMAIFIMMVFMGFPGILSNIIGGSVASLIEYAAFGLQFVVVLLGSGDDVKNIKLINLEPPYWMLYIFAFYATVDSLYIADNKKTVTITVIHLVLTILFAIWMVQKYDLEQMLEIIYFAQFMYIAICVICMVIFPKIPFYTYHGGKTFRGLYRTKNEAAAELSFGILVQCTLFRLRVQKKSKISIVFLAVLFVQFILLIMARAMGSLLVTFGFIGYMVFYSMQKRKWRIPLGLMFVIATIGFIFFALTILQALGPFLESLGKDASITGRVPVWDRLITIMQESHTMTGYGLEMFWKTPSALKSFKAGFDQFSWAATTASSSHSTMMETWCNLGLIGVALYYLMYLAADRGVKHLEENQYLFCSSFLVMFTISSLTERQTAPGELYVMVSYMTLAIMYQALFRYKLTSYKKAKIYSEDEAAEAARRLRTTRQRAGDLSMFQSRFSNIADNAQERNRQKDAVKKLGNIAEQEEAESGNKLEKLLKEFDDDSEQP